MAFNKLSLEQKLLTKTVWKDGCLVWIGQKCRRGYGRLRLNGRLQKASRLMYELRHGAIPDGLVVRHACDNPACINIDHLSVGTQADNMRDKAERGRSRSLTGETHPRAKLTATQVEEIRSRYIPRKYGHGAPTPLQVSELTTAKGRAYHSCQVLKTPMTSGRIAPLARFFFAHRFYSDGRECDGYNTPKGKKSARLVTGFQLPPTPLKTGPKSRQGVSHDQ